MSKGQSELVPRHVGFIVDGNRRWAKAHGLPVYKGHRAGYEVMVAVLDHLLAQGVSYVSMYVFSTENWNRSKQEVAYLMKLLGWVLRDKLQEVHDKNIRILWVGSTERLQPAIIEAIHHAEQYTKDNTAGTLVLCLNHGGHREVAEAVQRIVLAGVSAEDVSEELIGQYIDHPEVPPIDLVIRTSGEQRLSNFMLWRTGYSELIFRDELWPDFTASALDECLIEYRKRQRRFGG